MAKFNVNYRPDYKFAMSDAHRRPAHHFGMPAITWHTAFWQPANIDQSEWIKTIELFALAIFDTACSLATKNRTKNPIITNLQEAPSGDTRGEHRLLKNVYQKAPNSSQWPEPKQREGTDKQSRYETVQIDFVWESLPVSIRFELFEEYVTMTLFIRFWKNPKGGSADEKLFSNSSATNVQACNALTRIASVINERRKTEEEGRDERQDRRDIAGQLQQDATCSFLYKDIWNALLETLITNEATKKLYDGIGLAFADFRGLILQCNIESDPTRPATMRPANIPMHPCKAIPRTHTRSAIGAKFSSDADISHWVEGMLPVLLALESATTLKNNPSDAIEYTFSTTTRNRCIFGTGFGHQEPDDPHPTANNESDRSGKPISYVILAAHDDHREIGRVANRLHTMGTLRLAALQALSQMLVVESDLSRLKEILISAALTLSDVSAARNIDAMNLSAGQSEESDIYSVRENQIRTQLANVRDGLTALDEKVDGGIIHRRGMSQYYLRTFDALVKAIEFEPIFGYQPYGQFVTHRLTRAFGKIEEVGQRRIEVAELEKTLRNQFLIYLSESHQFSIRRNQIRIENMQYWAEVAFLLFVLPYYASEIINHSFLDKAHKPFLGVLAVEPQAVSLGIFSACIIFVFMKYRQDMIKFRKKHPTTFARRAGKVFAVLGAVTIAAMVAAARS